MGPEDEGDERIIRRGVHDDFHWLTATGDVYTGTLLSVCARLITHCPSEREERSGIGKERAFHPGISGTVGGAPSSALDCCTLISAHQRQ
jgi:hypothetical protein